MAKSLYAHLNLAIGAPRRLAILKREFEQAHAKNPHHRSQSWRDMRYARFNSCDGAGLSQGFSGANERTRVPVWYSQGGQFFNREWFCDETPDGARIDHKGWFCDEDCSDKTRGIVVKLSHGRYLAGYWASLPAVRVYFGDIHDTARDASLMADEHARVIGESEREYRQCWNEARGIESDIEDGLTRLRECLALRNNKCFQSLRDEARDLMNAIRENREKLANDYAGVL